MICVDKIEETNVETANKIREEIKGIAHSFTCDVTKRDQIDDLHTRVSTEYPLPRNKRFLLKFLSRPNASKFAIYLQ